MVLTNLGPMQEFATAAVRKDTEPPMMPVKERRAIVTRTRRNGLNEKWAKAVEKVKAKAKGKEKGKPKEIGTGKVMARSYLAPTTTRAMATANGATTVVSPMMGQKGESVNTRPWL